MTTCQQTINKDSLSVCLSHCECVRHVLGGPGGVVWGGVAWMRQEDELTAER